MTQRIEYTDQLGQEICELIASGQSVAKSCADKGYAESAFFFRLAKDSKLQEQYARAKEFRADARFDSSDKVIQDMRDGIIDSRMARVELEKIKWQCAKERPKVYGDKLDVTGIPAAQTNVLLPVRERIKRIRSSQGDAAQA